MSYTGLAPREEPTASKTVDPDIATAKAIELVMTAYLQRRAHEAESIDPLFARDVADRVRDFAMSGGKRLRARFLWWGWRAGGGGTTGTGAEAALRLGAALELVQACALIHDDVMDGSSLRRGSPALHVAFARQHFRSGMRGDRTAYGRAAAILAGDLALAWADDLVLDIDADPAARRRIRDQWQVMRSEMVAGQYLDMHAHASAASSPEEALHIACLKTALYSAERPLALGAALAGTDAPTAKTLCSAGRCAGIAFQLRDDLLGVFGDPAVTGKPSGEDIRSGKLTYLVAMARTLAEKTGDTTSQRILERAVGDPQLSEDDLDRLRQVLEDTGARSAVEAEIERLMRRSRDHLHQVSISGPAHHGLSALLGSAVGIPPLATHPTGATAGSPS
ncbi:polyprenyl synthetase family protein [Streptomyces sp. NBC_00234]|uniref:polyprenyl synthetase family protein n=1 Tax=Streptomyces sp. NBC_00234 TaxID=2903638 RepID=UPI002E2A0265|nr:polyprenyl synthetase family protein [Streptomyces sp. NBC_00234]